jgi:hypothetical protein
MGEDFMEIAQAALVDFPHRLVPLTLALPFPSIIERCPTSNTTSL